jgi:hypothetical protein
MRGAANTQIPTQITHAASGCKAPLAYAIAGVRSVAG